MKKFLLFLIILTVCLGMSTASAQNVLNTNLAKTEEISFNIKGLSEIFTVSSEDAAFVLTFNSKDKDYVTYNVQYQINGNKTVNAGNVQIEPGKNVVKEFKINVKNGRHTLKVDVYKKEELVKSFSDEIVVMDKYKDNFMDFYNPTGFCTHFAHYGANSPSNTTTLGIFDLIEWSGVNRIRDGHMPHRTEPYPGVYNFFGSTKWSKTGDTWAGWWAEKFIQTDYELYVPIMAPLNSYYYEDLPKDIKKTEREVRTTKSITGYSEYIVEALKNVKNTKAVEIWNEPNIANFWTSQVDVEIDYPNLLKQAALTIREYSDDVRIDAFSVANDLQVFIDPLSEHYGVYPYYDCISAHPYVWSVDMEDRDKYNSKLIGLTEAVERYGGWKRIAITETGQSVYNGVKMNDGKYMTEHDAASKNIKQIIMAAPHGIEHVDIYQLNADKFIEDTDPNNRERGFGVVRYHSDGTIVPQESYIAIKEYSQQLAGAIFVGRVDMGENIYAYLYQKDGLPKMVLWYYNPDYSERVVSFGNEKLDFYDMYGNKVATQVSEISVGIAPYYVTGLDEKWFFKAAKDEIAGVNAKWLENYTDISGEEISNKAKTLFSDTESALETVNSAEDIKVLTDKYFEFGYEIINSAKSGALSLKDASRMLFGLYNSAKILNSCYIGVFDGNDKIRFDIVSANSKVGTAYKNSKGCIKQYSDAMYKYAKLYKQRADEVMALKEDNNAKAGVVNGWNLMAQNIYGWVSEFMQIEPSINYGITIRVPGYDTQCFVGETKHIRSVLRNASELDFTGTYKIFNEKNELVYESKEFNLKPGDTLDKPVDVLISEPENGEFAYYTFKLIDSAGTTVTEQKNKILIKNSIIVEVLPINDEVEYVKEAKLKVINQRPEDYSFKLELNTSDNFKLGYKDADITLAPYEERIISIPITSIEHTNFHCYSLEYKAIDKQGAVVANSTQLLNFTNVTKAKEPVDVKGFNGDISDWYDAYPIYAGQPNDASVYSNWTESSSSMRSFLKWDEDYLYLLTEVYDDIQYQDYTGKQIWQGDSIQIALDCNNDKTDGYNEDDYEIGTAICSDGIGFWAWAGTVAEGNITDWINIVRDEEGKVTRYLMAMPKANISNLKLVNGGYIGLNIAVNDSDVFGREGFIQFTDGLADGGGKHPYKFQSFKLCSDKNIEIKDGYSVFK